MVPSTKIGPVSPCLLIPHDMVHFAGWSDISIILCGFSEVQILMFCLFAHSLRWKWASSLNHRQSKVVE